MLISHSDLTAILEYRPETGEFIWISSPKPGVKAGDVAGSITRYGYVLISIKKKGYRAHRLAWFYTKKEWPKLLIDHINGIKSDNRIANLRDVSNTENLQNRSRPSKNNKSGELGVCVDARRKGFRADIRINGKLKFLGTFLSIDDARNAYVAAKRELHEGCTA